MSEYFPEPKSLGGRVKNSIRFVELCKKKSDLKDATGVDLSKFAKKVDLAILKSNVDKLDIDKLKNVPTNLSNLKSKVDKLDVHKLGPVPVPDVVKNDVAKKDLYHAKIKNIEDKIPGITNLATNASLNANINEVKVEIPSFTNLGTNASLNAKINEVIGEIPNITKLYTTAALTSA